MKGHQKTMLRALMRERRSLLFHNHPQAGKIIATLFLDFFPFRPSTLIGAYWPLKNELDVRPLLGELMKRGVQCALPCLTQQGMSFRVWGPSIPLTEGKFHIFEPPSTCHLSTPDVILVPLLAFDRRGHRLGYGHGYYDRYLSSHKVLTIGVGFKGQEVKNVPHEPHDFPLDYILTEAGVIPLRHQEALLRI